MFRLRTHLSRAGLAALVAVTFLAPAAPAAAHERLVRHLGADEGLPTFTAAVEQDARGFLWIATYGGLFRYDGERLLRWAADVLPSNVDRIATGADGSVYVAEHNGRLARLTATGAEILDGPDGTPLRDVRNLQVDERGRLWVVVPAGVLRRDPTSGRWSGPLVAPPPGTHVQRVLPDGAGGAFAAAGAGLYHIGPDDRATRVAELPLQGPGDGVTEMLAMPDGALFLCTWDGAVLRFEDGVFTLEATMSGVAHDLARRGDAVWIVADDSLGVVRPGRPPELLHSADHPAYRGRWLTVDREGSLWVASALGLFQLPEPDTVAWTGKDGLTVPRKLSLARNDEGVWATSWGFIAGVIDDTVAPASAHEIEGVNFSAPCVDGAGVLWGAGLLPGDADVRIVSRHEGAFRSHGGPLVGNPRCAPDGAGGVWLVEENGLWHTFGGDDEPRFLGLVVTPAGPRTPRVAHEDPRGVVWLTADGATPGSASVLCHAPRSAVLAGGGWACETLPPGDPLVIASTPSGAVWVGTLHEGVLRRSADGRIDVLPGAAALPSVNVPVLEAAPSGGLWVGGVGYVVRVEERTDRADGWQIVETLTAYEGVTTPGAEDVLEDPDGTVWATGPAGVLQVPPEARGLPRLAPSVELVEVRVDGRAVAAPGTYAASGTPGAAALATPAEVALPYGANELELRLAGLSFRDADALRFRMRLHAGDPWSAPSAGSVVQLVDLPPGTYDAELSASLDGASWSSTPARLSFTVARPWYRAPWAWALAAAALAGAAFGLHRGRLALALRLERQRLQIAMDLHDEMGSGLGSIGILAGLTAEGRLDADALRRAAARIAGTAVHLGAALTDIVWSLREGAGTLPALAHHLTERAASLFPGESPALRTDLPADWPAVALTLPVRRALQLIAQEALHNAARHAAAQSVTLGLRAEGRRWRLWVEDDGVGLRTSAAPPAGRGLGLRSMQRRAGRIGAALTFEPARADGRGTRVSVLFDPGAQDRRPPRWQGGARSGPAERA